jgi:dipeptidyl aminopeptidase/acylaminoacyl peptidase
MYATCWHDAVLTDFFGVAPAALRPAAAILAYGIYDYHLMFGEISDPFAKQLSAAAGIAYLGTTTPGKDLLDTVSPALRVTGKTPPTFLWTTVGDRLVPVENTVRMAGALVRAGVPFEVHVFEGGDHGLSLSDQATAAAQTQIDADAAKWVGLVAAWLEKRFALPIPERPTWTAALEDDHADDETPR